jgi:phosphorylcholine metabolism protein LicD
LSSKKSKIKSAQSRDLNPAAHAHYSSVRLQIDRNTSEKIAALRYDAQQRGEDNFSLSAVVEDAIEMYCECIFEGREIPTPIRYSKFLKSI